MQTEHEQDGPTTEATSTEYQETTSSLPLNAKIIDVTTYPDGLPNYIPKLLTTEDFLGLSSTSAVERLSHLINTPRSHLGCWCNSSKTRGSSSED